MAVSALTRTAVTVPILISGIMASFIICACVNQVLLDLTVKVNLKYLLFLYLPIVSFYHTRAKDHTKCEGGPLLGRTGRIALKPGHNIV